MIKELINDISLGKATLTQALNRAKVFAHKINNPELKIWINLQLEGYDDFEQENLPSFRNLKCKTYLTHKLPNGSRHDKEVVGGEEYEQYLNRFGYTGSIPLLEQQLISIDGNTLMAALEPIQYQTIAQADRFGKWVTGGYRQFDRGQLVDIVEKTKQRLFDTLLELDTQFPEIDDKTMKSKETKKEVQQIVNNHIYGNSSGLVIGTGSTIIQSDITNTTNTTNTWQELEKLGVENTDAVVLK